MQKNTFTAANDNPAGITTIDAALMGLVDLLARVEAKRRTEGKVAGDQGCGVPANLPHAPQKGNTK